MNEKKEKKQVKAVGLISGGLDSSLAAKVIKDLGVDVYGVYFSMPWGCCDKNMANKAAEQIGIKFIVLQLDERYLEIVRKPKHGYGTALNPCVDCRIHMFSRAAQYMKHIDADFVFTGEVLGQRPMSQRKDSMRWIEKESGLEGKLLRPLSAQLLEETDVEKNGLVDRNKLLHMVGRSRKPQYTLANDLDISAFNQPAGGCLLTDPNFANRMKDTLKYGYRNFRETVALQWGRHYRINDQFKAVIGRNDEENTALIRYAHADDIIMQFQNREGATLILKGENPPPDVLKFSAGLIQRFSKYKKEDPLEMKYWKAGNANVVNTVEAEIHEDEFLEKLKL